MDFRQLMPVMPPPGTAGAGGSNSIYTGAPTADPIVPVGAAGNSFDPLSHVYVEPVKAITSEACMDAWMKSEGLARVMQFVQIINEACKGKTNTQPPLGASAIADALMGLLATLDGWIALHPPLDAAQQRFGNRAFRGWVERLERDAHALLQDAAVLPPSGTDGGAAEAGAAAELAAYLVQAFGHKTRLDYGSGHELAFVCFLACLHTARVIVTPADLDAIARRVLPTYFELVRRLQTTYRLEPAGSHGVWGLDDHQFLCYYWGAAQLVGHARIRPKSVLTRDIVDAYAKDYMYLRAIQYINETKTGPFHEHSPMLYDISGVPTWAKVNSGMFKMYVAEVIQKFPVVQHIPFGSLLPFEPAVHQ
ncbi:Serine/threonine-protein phosphatase 2A activator [Entophlyctis luteolus]|nr:Serine/threonine-protein phosphatase 2A activator [Entophlyctis luteolus]